MKRNVILVLAALLCVAWVVWTLVVIYLTRFG